MYESVGGGNEPQKLERYGGGVPLLQERSSLTDRRSVPLPTPVPSVEKNAEGDPDDSRHLDKLE